MLRALEWGGWDPNAHVLMLLALPARLVRQKSQLVVVSFTPLPGLGGWGGGLQGAPQTVTQAWNIYILMARSDIPSDV